MAVILINKSNRNFIVGFDDKKGTNSKLERGQARSSEELGITDEAAIKLAKSYPREIEMKVFEVAKTEKVSVSVKREPDVDLEKESEIKKDPEKETLKEDNNITSTKKDDKKSKKVVLVNDGNKLK